MKSKIGILLVASFAILPFYWERTRDPGYLRVSETDEMDKSLPALILATSLRDSLPDAMVDILNLGSVKGKKIKYHNGSYASYYRYSADRRKLLTAFALIPVAIREKTADTSYRLVDRAELEALNQTLPLAESSCDEGFWSASLENFDVLESVKPPFRHLILLSKTDPTVFHRVTPLI